MAYHSKYSGAEVDALLDKIKDDNVGSIDSSLSTTSENPVKNKVITEELNKKANKTDIATINGQPLTNGGNIEVVTYAYDDTEIKGKLTELDSQIDGEATARTNADAELQTQINSKQEALTLTVKDNGNIVLANIQGQSKEFMPATPSGDPMHYYYISLGMKYDNGFFQLNGLNLTASEALDTLKSLRIVNKKDRTNGCRFLSFRTNIPDNYATTYTSTEQRLIMLACFAGIRTLEVVNIANNTNINYPLVCELGYAFLDCINLKKIIDYIKPTNVNHAFDSCSSLSSVNIAQLSISISFSSCPLLSSESVLFMVQNEAATSPITITLHADVYNRCMANADILAALETHTNISLASA